MSTAHDNRAAPALSMGRLCRLAGCTARTVRFYEAQGLIAHSARTAGGRRLFSPDAVPLVRLVKALGRAGYSIKKIKALLKLSRSGRTGDRWVTTRLRGQLQFVLAAIRHRLDELDDARRALASVLEDTSRCSACASDDCAGCANLALLRTLGTPLLSETTSDAQSQ